MILVARRIEGGGSEVTGAALWHALDFTLEERSRIEIPGTDGRLARVLIFARRLRGEHITLTNGIGRRLREKTETLPK